MVTPFPSHLMQARIIIIRFIPMNNIAMGCLVSLEKEGGKDKKGGERQKVWWSSAYDKWYCFGLQPCEPYAWISLMVYKLLRYAALGSQRLWVSPILLVKLCSVWGSGRAKFVNQRDTPYCYHWKAFGMAVHSGKWLVERGEATPDIDREGNTHIKIIILVYYCNIPYIYRLTPSASN